jgi:hypothetical protein
MELAAELRRALAGVCATGVPEVHEDGEWLASLSGLQYEVRPQGDAALLHLWSPQQSLVRRVLRIAEESPEHLIVEVTRFGRARHAQLQVVAAGVLRDPRRRDREQFRSRLRQILTDHFPDEIVESLLIAADLHRSISGSYTRGIMRNGSDAYAVLGAAPTEDGPTIDKMLTFGLIWLDHAKARARRQTIRGLRLFVPSGHAAITAHRLNALDRPQEVELYEYDPLYWRVRRIAVSDTGNLATWVVSRREIDQLLATAQPEAERIRSLAPDDIRMSVAAATREVSLRFLGLEFARLRMGQMWFGLGDHQQVLTPQRWGNLEKLLGQLKTYRNAQASDTKHRFYRAQPERWLETLVVRDPSRIDARLDGKHIYTQVPAFSAADRGIIDLLGVMRDGRLAVMELKASEDIHVVMQAVDYWLRVRWHHEQDDFRRFGYFPDVALQPKPPILILVAPGFQFHPSNDIVLRYLSREIELVRVGLGENWRKRLRVVFRQQKA